MLIKKIAVKSLKQNFDPYLDLNINLPNFLKKKADNNKINIIGEEKGFLTDDSVIHGFDYNHLVDKK